MDATHLHLIVTHVPVLVSIFSVIILAWGMIRKNRSLYQLAMVGFVVAALFSIVALETGESAEETIEHLGGAGTESFIHNHEEAATTTYWMALIVGIISLGGFAVQKYWEKYFKKYLGLVLVLGLISSGAFSYTAYLGGQIRHTEVRSQQAQLTTPPQEEGASGYEEDDD